MGKREMNEIIIDEAQARVLDILEQIKKLNQMIALHEEESKDTVMVIQCHDMKDRFLAELNELLAEYEVKVLLKDNRAA
ncbi:MAG: hypothetical protein AAF992_20630 [Bacteroidota bacterium]